MATNAALRSEGKMHRIPPLRLEESGFVPAEVPGLRKAAILLVALGKESATTLFQTLSERDVAKVTQEIAELGDVSPIQLTQVMVEFFGLLETQRYVVRGGIEYATKMLTEAFGEQKAQQLLAQVIRLRDRNTGDLALMQKMEPGQLSKFLEHEQPQTVALVLAHLDVKPASAVLLNLDESVRVEVVRKMAEMQQFSPEMAQKVALVLNNRLKGLGATGR